MADRDVRQRNTISNGLFGALARAVAKNRGGWKMVQRKEFGGPVTVALVFHGHTYQLNPEQAEFVWHNFPRGEGRRKHEERLQDDPRAVLG